MRDINVVMLSWEYPPRIVGGIAAHVYNLCQALGRKGVKTNVVTCDFPGAESEEEVDGTHVYRVDSYHFQSPDFASWVLLMNLNMQMETCKIVKSAGIGNVDIIHAHDWLVAPAGIALKHSFRKPLVTTMHSTEYGRRGGIDSNYQRMIHEVEWWLNYEAWKTVCCSRYMADHVAYVLGVPRNKIAVIPNGVDTSKFEFNLDREAFKSNFAAPWERVVLYVGRLVPEKGVNVLVGAVPKILGSFPNVKFIITGDGYMKEPLMDMARNLGVYHKIFFTGFVNDLTLRSLYMVADVVVVPSLFEPFGIVALEAMAAGVPVVVSDSGGLSEIVKHDVDGVKTYANNSDSLAWGVLRVLTNPEYAYRIRVNALKKVEEMYDWNKIAESTISLYNSILEEYDKSGWKPKGKHHG